MLDNDINNQLAADYGMDVLLVGRNPDKLKSVARLIREESVDSQRRVITLVADFAEDPVARNGHCGSGVSETNDHFDDEDDDVGDQCFCNRDSRSGDRCTRWYPRLRAVVETRLQTRGGVGVLINCAGTCYPHPEYFAGMLGGHANAGDGSDAPPPVVFNADFCENADASVRCNVAAAVHACRLVLPGMLARGRGLVINVGSASASVPPAAPLMALYAATKKFLEKFSADLDAECAHLSRKNNAQTGSHSHGVRVQCVRPAYVATAMLRSANPDVDVDCGSDDDDDDAADEYGERCWWSARVRRAERSVQRWLVPSARRWVRSALRRGGRLYAAGLATNGPANYTGYCPHTLLVWCLRLISAVTPNRWFIDSVLIPGMLTYRAKGRAAIVAAAAKEKNRKCGASSAGISFGVEQESGDDEQEQ